MGVSGGCRYVQQLVKYRTHYIYESSPIGDDDPYFDPVTCLPASGPSRPSDPCTCSVSWEANREDLKARPPLPTPSVTPSPVLSASASPIPEPEPTPVEVVVTEATTTPVVFVPPVTVAPVDETAPVASTDETDGESSEDVEGSASVEGAGGAEVSQAPEPSETDAGVDVDTDDSVEPDTDDNVNGTEDPASDDGSVVVGGLPGSEGVDGAASVDNDIDESSVVEPLDPSLSPEDDGDDDDSSVCVDQEYLVRIGFTQESFVHDNGIESTVLCPIKSSLPCGTADHMVRVDGTTMSYDDYCALSGVSCSQREMVVNAVYSHMWDEMTHVTRLQDPSSSSASHNVELTMFDARYGETQQIVLHAAMRNMRRVRKRFSLLF